MNKIELAPGDGVVVCTHITINMLVQCINY